MNKWDNMTTEERTILFRYLFPFDSILLIRQVLEWAKLSWKDMPEGTTKNAIEAYLKTSPGLPFAKG